jgi:Zn-dependent peptidase ImmA (M78 family)/transcriptional regulator with XRE-family HTH domain
MTIPITQADLDAIVGVTRAFVPERLTLAREAANLDVKGLADRIGTTASAVSQLENRKNGPKTETLMRLSLALGVPPAFFALPVPPDLAPERCHFRRRRGASKREQRYVLARGRLVREVVHYLEGLLNFPEEAVTPLQRAVSSHADIATLAQEVRDAWGVGQAPIGNVIALLEVHGVIPVEVRGHSAQLDAFSTWADGRPMIFLSTDKACASRRRWDAAHELGHLLMHSNRDAGDQELEREADLFASAFLIPQAQFVAVCSPRLSWTVLRDIKRRWGVSLSALVRKARDLAIYSEATYRRANVQHTTFGWRQHGEPDEPPMEHPSLITQAMEQLAAAGHPISVTAAELGHGALLEDLIWPRGRAA